MLEKVNAYLKDKMHLPALFTQRFGHGVCALQILPDEVLLCYLLSVGGELQIQFCESFSYEMNSLKTKLTKFVKLHKLEGVHTTWVLAPQHYQLIKTEALPVSSTEFQTSIRWKIKDSLSFPIDDTVIDKYEIPSLKIADKAMIMVVVARKSYLNTYVKIFKESGLVLNAIDTTELSLRNLTAMFEEDEKTSALIYFETHRVQLLITHRQKLFFSRFIELNPSDEQEQRLTRLVLEIQRSFDYFQSQWRLPLPSRIFLAGFDISTELQVENWSHQLSLPVQIFDINTILSVKGNLPIAKQGKYLPVLGGVLRRYVEVHETTD